ncbi:MAG: hypothetical protein Fur0025_47830 [Oscillatoriaceae cyanobacterium]
MSDYKKSKKAADSKKSSGDLTAMDALFEEIDQAEPEAEQQMQILDTKNTEIKQLEEKFSEIGDKLGEISGDALMAVEQDISQKIEQKQAEADQCKSNLESIKTDMEQRRSEIQAEITKRDDALSRLEEAEKDCDVDLSAAQDAVIEEKEHLEDYQSKVEAIIGKIDSALSSQPETRSSQPETRKNNFFQALADGANKFVAGASIATNMFMGMLDTHDRAVNPLVSDNPSISSSVRETSNYIKEISNQAGDLHGLNSQALDIDAVQESERERRKSESEKQGRNKSGITGKN